MEYYCHNCETPQYHDDLIRYSEHDTGYHTFLCGHCKADEVQEMDYKAWVDLFDITISDLRKVRRDMGVVGEQLDEELKVVVGKDFDPLKQLTEIEKRLDLIIEYFEDQ